MELQPIETKYNGMTFRSRLEARWAVFFDQLGIRWFYEYEGYQTPVGWYLPDFWLPDVYLRDKDIQGVLFEVKPDNYDKINHEQLAEVAEKLGVGAILAVGFGLNEGVSPTLYQIVPYWDNYMMLYVCRCGRAKFEYGAESNYRICVEPTCKMGHAIQNLSQAFTSARNYRFY